MPKNSIRTQQKTSMTNRNPRRKTLPPQTLKSKPNNQEITDMDSDTEYALIHRPADGPGAVEANRDDASDIMAEQESIADVDTCIHQAAEALRTGRESVARSF